MTFWVWPYAQSVGAGNPGTVAVLLPPHYYKSRIIELYIRSMVFHEYIVGVAILQRRDPIKRIVEPNHQLKNQRNYKN